MIPDGFMPSTQLGIPSQSTSLVLTCEHASPSLPEHWVHARSVHALLTTHWAFDIGVKDVVSTMVDRGRVVAVLAGFSRLYCDANRDPMAEDFIVQQIEQQQLVFNCGLNEEEQRARREVYNHYHAHVDRVIEEVCVMAGPPLLVAIHSFTPVYRGTVRPFDMGILFDRDSPIVDRLKRAMIDRGYKTLLNEPYSGKQGMIYSIQRHGQAQQCPYLEIEIRQDLIESPKNAAVVANDLYDALLRIQPGPSLA